jgi:signal transduction histidine kinase
MDLLSPKALPVARPRPPKKHPTHHLAQLGQGQKLAWLFRCVEWLVVLMGVYNVITSPLDTSGLRFTWPMFWLSTAALLGWSSWFPIKRNSRVKLAYLVTQTCLIIAPLWVDIDWGMALFGMIIKACLFLHPRAALGFTVGATSAYLLSFYINLPRFIQIFVQQIKSNSFEKLANSSYILLSVSVSIVTWGLFAMLVGFLIAAERSSRQRAEALTREVEALAVTVERTRIAREIHDSLGHTLTTLDVHLEVAQKMQHNAPDSAAAALNIAKQLASQCLQDVRVAVQTMRQSNFDLSAAIATLVEQVSQAQTFTVQLHLDLPPLPLQIGHQLYCIVQEGLTNVQKHAQARQVSLTARTEPDGRLWLELVDDGIGFDPSQPPTGFGLRGMQERCQILGGQLTLTSDHQQGTRIYVEIQPDLATPTLSRFPES